jgi:hypothetical protein
MRETMVITTLTRFIRCESGSVAVSTALIAPLLIMMVSGVVDLGRATYDVTSLVGAVRAGGEYALRFPTDKDGIILAVKEASNLKGVTIPVPVVRCECPNGVYAVCASSSCGSGVTQRQFIEVSASVTFSKIMPSSSIVVPSNLLAKAVMRTQ